MVTAKFVEVGFHYGRVHAAVQFSGEPNGARGKTYHFEPGETIDDALNRVQMDVDEANNREASRSLVDELAEYVTKGTVIRPTGSSPPEVTPPAPPAA